MYGTILMSPFVKVETIDKGKELGATDVKEIEKAVQEGWLKLVTISKEQTKKTNRLVMEARIGMGEAEALILAKDGKSFAILDDKEARAIAKSWGVEYTSTVMVLYEAFVKGLINYDELVEDLSKLTKIMWISTDVITEIIKKARKVRK